MIKRELRKWRREGDKGDKYRDRKLRYKKFCEKKKEKVERWEEKVKEAKMEGQIWKIINRERKSRKRINEEIDLKEWEIYFKGLLGGVEWRAVNGAGKNSREEEEEVIGGEELKKVIRRLKDGKAGRRRCPKRSLEIRGEEVEEWILDLCRRVWRGEGWPKNWREGVIVPIVKKGMGEKVEEYRGITIAQSAYRVYTTILAEKLKEEVEGKGILPPNQTGFRKGVAIIDNIYVLNYLINKQVKRKRKLILMFLDLRAAFDLVDRRQISETMRKKGLKKGLVRRCEEVMRETVSRVRMGETCGERFWTVRGIGQGCPLSPSLFTLLLADVKEELRRGGWRKVKPKERKIYTLAYADDMVMLAEDEEGMKGLMSRMEKYLEGKGLELNVEKTKVM